MHDKPLPTDLDPVYPILDAFRVVLKVSNPTGYRLVNSGELETFTIGSRRYTTGQALARLIERRISEGVDPHVSEVKRSAGHHAARKRHGTPPEAA